MKSKSLIFVISAPSGTGKTTICQEVIKARPGLKRSVSLTTRSKRSGEKDGLDYNFISEEEFLKKIKRKEFAEWAKVLNNYYGTPKKTIEGILKEGQDVILNIDVQGALQIKDVYPEAVLIFILPPSMEVLKKRLVFRKTDTQAEIKRRLKLARKELLFAKKYDYTVINDSLKKATGRVKDIIKAERTKVRK